MQCLEVRQGDLSVSESVSILYLDPILNVEKQALRP